MSRRVAPSGTFSKNEARGRGPLEHTTERVLEHRRGPEGVYPVPGQVVGAAIRGARLRGEAGGSFARVEERGITHPNRILVTKTVVHPAVHAMLPVLYSAPV